MGHEARNNPKLRNASASRPRHGAASWRIPASSRRTPDCGRPYRTTQAGYSLRRYQALGDEADLDAAVDAFAFAVALTGPASSRRASRLSNLGLALRERFRRTNDLMPLDSAVRACEDAVRLAKDGVGAVRINLSLCLQDRFLLTGDSDDLERAVTCAEQACAQDRSAGAAVMLGDLLRLRYEHIGRVADLLEGLALLKQALAATPPSGADYPRRAANLGIGLLDKHDLSSDRDDLAAAMGLLESAIAGFPTTSPDRPAALAHLGLAHLHRYRTQGDLDDLDQAVAMLSKALTTGLAFDQAAWTNNLATVLLERARWRDTEAGRAHDLDDAVQLLEDALASGLADTDRAILAGSLGNLLRDRYHLLRHPGDLDEAIEALQQALAPGTLRRADSATVLANLGSAYLDRFARDRRAGPNAGKPPPD